MYVMTRRNQAETVNRANTIRDAKIKPQRGAAAQTHATKPPARAPVMLHGNDTAAWWLPSCASEV